jgi:hypothetical protein
VKHREEMREMGRHTEGETKHGKRQRRRQANTQRKVGMETKVRQRERHRWV